VVHTLMGKAGGVATSTTSVPVTLTETPAKTHRGRLSLPLRARVTVAFAIAGLVVSLSLSLITYLSARSYLLDQRDRVARTQAFVNARLTRDVLRNPDEQLADFVGSLRTERDGAALLNVHDTWYSQSVGFQEALPASLRAAVLNGETGRQRYTRDGQPYLAVGVSIAEADASYFEVFPLASLERTLGVIGRSLVVGSIITTLVAASIGWWASRQVLKPVSRVADAAGELASGGLDTRLPRESDPDLDRLAQSFNEMAAAVQDRIQREARFASDVSHELRSPITALTAAVEVLDSRRDDLPARSQQALGVVVSQVRRFDQMVLDLLEISRLDAGVAELNLEPVLLGDVLRRITTRYSAESVPITVERPFDEQPVGIDKRRLERIVANYLLNAEQHAGGAVRVAVEPGAAGMVRIVVEDAGPGVSAAEKERIFERFARGTNARHRVGTGLGLALVAEHAHLHGGEAWVADRPGGGSRFIVELPADQG
jgi:two-component system, OmpR family, sensor histidine kinase MtrB